MNLETMHKFLDYTMNKDYLKERLKNADSKVRIYVERFLKEIEEDSNGNGKERDFMQHPKYKEYINAKEMFKELRGNLETILKRQYVLMSEVSKNSQEEERTRKNQFAEILLDYLGPNINEDISKLKFYISKKAKAKCFELIKKVQNLDSLVHYLGAKQNKAIELLKQEVITDPLTGLFNERYIIDQLEKEIERTKRNQEKNPENRDQYYVSILFIDVNNFKNINDSYGHLMGDYALKMIAEGLKKFCRATDIVGRRYKGDEFVVIVTEATIKQVDELASRLVKEVSSYATNKFSEKRNNSNEKIGISIGSSTYDYDANSPTELLNHADAAMYSIKGGGGGYKRYNKEETEIERGD